MFSTLRTYRQPELAVAILCFVAWAILLFVPWQPAVWPALPRVLAGGLYVVGAVCWIRSRPKLYRGRRLMELGALCFAAATFLFHTDLGSDTVQALAALAMFTCMGIGGYLTWRSGFEDMRRPLPHENNVTGNE
ncbi:hypothetical protein [Lewinella sp. IMCC34183]|uniref:hypothetical protein n=1 Tax=Lewinella sp. IMCC34183 TaxID=2248762 RepID=UPI000E27C439|nr:hypothetical protein [Lewinella sp. IMCC34183]